MGFFDAPVKRVSKKEYLEHVRGALVAKGFTREEMVEVDQLFRGDMEESRDLDQGIDAHELEGGIAWLRANIGKHRLSASKVSALEEVMKRFI